MSSLDSVYMVDTEVLFQGFRIPLKCDRVGKVTSGPPQRHLQDFRARAPTGRLSRNTTASKSQRDVRVFSTAMTLF